MLLSVECEINLSNLYIYLTNSFAGIVTIVGHVQSADVRFPLVKTSLLKRSIAPTAKNQYRV